MNKKIFIIILIFLLSINYIVYAEENDYIYMYSYKNTTTNKIISYTHTFEESINVKMVYMQAKTAGYSDTRIEFYNSDDELIADFPKKDNPMANYYEVDFRDVKRVVMYCWWNRTTEYRFYDKVLFTLNLEDIIFDKNKQHIIYTFNKENFEINTNDIVFKDSQGIDIPFTYTILNNKLTIKPKSNLYVDNYTILLKKVTSLTTDGQLQTLENIDYNFSVQEELKLLNVIVDKINNVISYIFNKNIKVASNDISIIDELGNNQSFDFTVENNIIKVFIDLVQKGKYKLKIDKVKSLDDVETLSDIKDYEFEIQGIKLIHKNFGNYISSSLKNLILTFDRDLETAIITLKNNTEDIILNSSYIILEDKIIIDYDDFQDDTSYTLIIESLKSKDENTIDLLQFDFKTVKSSGDVGIDTIISEFLNIFTEAQNRGTKIVILAIALGIIFIIAKWLWNKTKLWLKKS